MAGKLKYEKAVVGKYGDQVILHCRILQSQDIRLAKLVAATGRSKSQLVSDAVNLLLLENHHYLGAT